MDAVHDSALELLNSEKFRNWNWQVKRIIIGKSADSEIDRAIRPRRVEKSNLTKDRALDGDSGRCRSAFRADADHLIRAMSISDSGGWRSLIPG